MKADVWVGLMFGVASLMGSTVEGMWRMHAYTGAILDSVWGIPMDTLMARGKGGPRKAYQGKRCTAFWDRDTIHVWWDTVSLHVPVQGTVTGGVCESSGFWGWVERHEEVSGENHSPVFSFTLHVWFRDREVRREMLVGATRTPHAASLLGVYRKGIWWGNLQVFANRWFFYRVQDGRFYVVDSPRGILYLVGWRVVWQGDQDGDGDVDWVLWGRSPSPADSLASVVTIRNLDRESQERIRLILRDGQHRFPWELVRRAGEIEGAIHFSSFFWPDLTPPLLKLRQRAQTWIRITELGQALLDRLAFVLLGGIVTLGLMVWLGWHYRKTTPPSGDALFLLDSHLRDLMHRGRKLREVLKGGIVRGRFCRRQEEQKFMESRNQTLEAMRGVMVVFLGAPARWMSWFFRLWWTLRVEWLMGQHLCSRWWMRRVLRKLDGLNQEKNQLLRSSHRPLREILEQASHPWRERIQVNWKGDAAYLDLPVYETYARRVEHLLHQAIRNALDARARTVAIHVEGDADHDVLILEVRDDGKGLSQELLALDPRGRIRRVFARGFSTWGQGRGQGFTETDLLWIEGILGGKVYLFPADLSSGEGTVFLLEIPIRRVTLVHHDEREDRRAHRCV